MNMLQVTCLETKVGSGSVVFRPSKRQISSTNAFIACSCIWSPSWMVASCDQQISMILCMTIAVVDETKQYKTVITNKTVKQIAVYDDCSV